MVRCVDTIGAMCNGAILGINDTYIEIFENVLPGKILNVNRGCLQTSLCLCVSP